MAIFERKKYNKVIIDDTRAFRVVFESSQNVQGHTEYVIRVHRIPDTEKTWHVCKRYNDFASLHGLVVQPSGVAIPLPPKKILGNMDRQFVLERQNALQKYLEAILMNPILASSLGVRRFLDPDTYVPTFQEQASQHVAMAMRSEMNYELLKPLPDVGWRFRKHYFQVRAKLNPRQDMALQWVEYGPDKVLSEKEIQMVLKLLIQVTHPHIQPIEYAHCTDTGSFVIRLFHSDGSLRDLLCLTKPKASFLKKYGNPKQVRALPVNEIQQYGRQILDALLFLKEKGIPYGHLHSGNVIFFDNQVRLLDVENGITGLPSYYRPYIVQHKKINSLEAVDVYCFGHVVYEMAIGHPLHQSVCDNIPSSCPYPVREILEKILSADALHHGLPSLADLRQYGFFADSRDGAARGSLKMPSSLRDALVSAGADIEKRLRAEQKLVRAQKKISKVQELLSSDGEIKKRQKRLKEERRANHANKNAKSPIRSESPTSTSTVTSAGTVTPPLAGMKSVMTPPSLPVIDAAADEPEPGRSALLSSIASFDKSRLRPKIEV